VPPGDPFPWRNQVTLTDCTFTSNKAAYGGAIFVDQQARMPCCSLRPGLHVVAPEAEDLIAACCLAQATGAVCSQAVASIVGGLFDSNTARAAGGAIVTSSSVVFSITGATFTNNGNLNCYEPPLVRALLHPGCTMAARDQAPRPPAACLVAALTYVSMVDARLEVQSTSALTYSLRKARVRPLQTRRLPAWSAWTRASCQATGRPAPAAASACRTAFSPCRRVILAALSIVCLGAKEGHRAAIQDCSCTHKMLYSMPVIVACAPCSDTAAARAPTCMGLNERAELQHHRQPRGHARHAAGLWRRRVCR